MHNEKVNRSEHLLVHHRVSRFTSASATFSGLGFTRHLVQAVDIFQLVADPCKEICARNIISLWSFAIAASMRAVCTLVLTHLSWFSLLFEWALSTHCTWFVQPNALQPASAIMAGNCSVESLRFTRSAQCATPRKAKISNAPARNYKKPPPGPARQPWAARNAVTRF